MSEQQNYGQGYPGQPQHGQPQHGQSNQQPPYPYSPPAGQQQQPQYPQQQQPYQNPYPQQAPQPYGQPPQQYGAPQGYPQQQPYPQAPPQQYPGPAQQYPGQQYPGQQPYGQPGQQPGLMGLQPDQLPQGPGPGAGDAAGKKPKKKRSGWATFFLVLFSPLIAVAFVFYGIYWVLAWLVTPALLAVHFVFYGLGLLWFSGVKILASGSSKHRLLQPRYPGFPPLWTGAYWVGLNEIVRSTVEGLAGILEIFN
jgi:nitrate reductase NapE component